MTEKEVRISPVLCIDCVKEIDEVDEGDFKAIPPIIHKHQKVCPNRDIRLLRIGRLVVHWMKGKIRWQQKS